MEPVRPASPKLELLAGPARYPDLAQAGSVLGMSGEALRKKFERGDLPRRFVLRVGPRTIRIDLEGLLAFLKANADQPETGPGDRVARTA